MIDETYIFVCMPTFGHFEYFVMNVIIDGAKLSKCVLIHCLVAVVFDYTDYTVFVLYILLEI